MDNLGNRTGTIEQRDGDHTYAAASPNLTNRYASIDSVSLAYDDAGNLTSDKDGYHYVYDYENRVKLIFKDINTDDDYDAGTDTLIAEYAYDALGRRIKKVDAIAAKTIYYIYNDNWQILEENEVGQTSRCYVYGNYIDEPLMLVIPAQAGIQTFYYVQDHLYSTAALVDDTGAVVERYEYDAYGQVHFLSPNYEPRTTNLYANAYYFTGRQLDILDGGSLHHMHYRHRDYSPFMGRFYQPDPMGIQPSGSMETNPFNPTMQYGDSLSLYLAFRALPTQNTDPYGLWGSLVHRDATRIWARRVGYPHNAAQAIGDADDAVDAWLGGKSPFPGGDQSYHFNRNRTFGLDDTRLVHYTHHYSLAESCCEPSKDNPTRAAEELGTALHPYQDIEAHGDFGLRDVYITVWHNSQSPQTDLLNTRHGVPGNYPDDPDLDTVGPIQYITKETTVYNPPYPPTTIRATYDYYRYTTGRNRYNTTRRKTTETLKEYRWYVQTKGGCKCKKYFLGVE